MDTMKKYAELLVDYSLTVQPGERVMIRATPEAEPLLREVYKYILERGAEPVLKVNFDWQNSLFYEHASDEILERSPDVALYEIERTDAELYIVSATNTKEMANADPKKQGERSKLMQPINEYALGKDDDGEPNVKWCVTLFPTNAAAQAAEMAIWEYEDFVYGAMFLDREDPVEEWKKLSANQQGLVDILNNSKEVRIVSSDTDLTLNIEGRITINSDGVRNMPSGEVFTAPIETDVNGYVTFSELPQMYRGREVNGIRLVFKDGEVVEATAEKNEEFLNEMLDTDDGACYLGELGIGTNAGIQRHVKHILFDEKIGGTIHLALGRAYEDCDGTNKSAIHWDLLKDLRKDGWIEIDSVKYTWNGEQWLAK